MIPTSSTFLFWRQDFDRPVALQVTARLLFFAKPLSLWGYSWRYITLAMALRMDIHKLSTYECNFQFMHCICDELMEVNVDIHNVHKNIHSLIGYPYVTKHRTRCLFHYLNSFNKRMHIHPCRYLSIYRYFERRSKKDADFLSTSQDQTFLCQKFRVTTLLLKVYVFARLKGKQLPLRTGIDWAWLVCKQDFSEADVLTLMEIFSSSKRRIMVIQFWKYVHYTVVGSFFQSR